MANRVKIVVKNESDWRLCVAGEPDDFVLSNGILDAGSHLPPEELLAKQGWDWTVSSPPGTPGPEGSVRYEFAILRLRVWIVWTDAATVKPGEVAKDENGNDVLSGMVSPFYVQWERLDGGVGELEPNAVKITDSGGKDVELAKVSEVSSVTVTYTLRVKNAQSSAPAPSAGTAVQPKGAVRPTGGSRVVVKSSFRTWDAPGITQKRKMLLAAIGNLFPQLWAPGTTEPEGADPNAGVRYKKMLCWNPGKGTSCTGINGMLETVLTTNKNKKILDQISSKWAFDQPLLQEAWVPWGANPAKPMPSVGDLYLIFRDVVEDVPAGQPRTTLKDPHIQHCGVILYVPESPEDTKENWVTADGGQRVNQPGDAAFLGTKIWETRVPGQMDPAKKTIWDKAMSSFAFAAPIQSVAYPHMAGGAESQRNLTDANRLLGWLDLDSPAIRFWKEAFDEPLPGDKRFRQFNRYTEYDYQFLGAWIDFLRGTRPDELAKWLAHLKDPVKNAVPWEPPAESVYDS